MGISTKRERHGVRILVHDRAGLRCLVVLYAWQKRDEGEVMGGLAFGSKKW